MSIKNNLPPSPSGTYVVYDQFHFGSPDHLAIPVKGQSEALDMYRFQSLANPDKSIGLTTAEKYKQYVATLSQPQTPITTMTPKEFSTSSHRCARRKETISKPALPNRSKSPSGLSASLTPR
jgi:hypothetical protein